jgi:hypothetical protein
MKRISFRHSILGWVGLASLLTCILACVSFSPDDSKVLYPVLNAKTTNFVICLYDRKLRQSEQVFVPPMLKNSDGKQEAGYLRPQWLPDGKSFMVAWLGRQSDGGPEGMTIAVRSLTGSTQDKVYFITNSDGNVISPLAMADSNVFITGKDDELVRLNLATGEIVTRKPTNSLMCFQTANNLVYLEEIDKTQMGFGNMNPKSFEKNELMRFKAPHTEGNIAVSSDGKKLAFIPKDVYNKTNNIVLIQIGKPEVSLNLEKLMFVEAGITETNHSSGHLSEMFYGNGAFSPKGDILYVAFESIVDKTNATYGFLEIPLQASTTTARQTTLIKKGKVQGEQDKNNAIMFQIGLSHDGQTLGVCSSYLIGDEPLIAAEDQALFLVDLSDPDRKVTKVPAQTALKQ